jgi:predicted amidophosphoribosyltransferase
LEATDRWDNVGGVFRLDEGWRVAGKHVLLVDDVITTGATTVTCAQEIMKAGNVRFSVLSLAVAGERMLEQPINPLV